MEKKIQSGIDKSLFVGAVLGSSAPKDAFILPHSLNALFECLLRIVDLYPLDEILSRISSNRSSDCTTE